MREGHTLQKTVLSTTDSSRMATAIRLLKLDIPGERLRPSVLRSDDTLVGPTKLPETACNNQFPRILTT